jgi:hypothetical protein
MRSKLCILLASLGVCASATVGAADSVETAVWKTRKLENFTLPLVVNSENGPLQEASCDQIYDTAKVLLLHLGARASDMRADMRSCYGYSQQRSIDVSFSVLAPIKKPKDREAGPLVEGHWERVTLNGNCRFLADATRKILPLFTTANVKLISADDCARLGVGLYAQILKAPQAEASAP